MVYTENIDVIPEFLVAGLRGIDGAGEEDLRGVRKKGHGRMNPAHRVQ